MPLTLRCVIRKASNSEFTEELKDRIDADWGMILQNYFGEKIDDDEDAIDLDDVNFHEHAERIPPNNNRVVVTSTIVPELEGLINLNEFEEFLGGEEGLSLIRRGLRVVECELIQAGGKRRTKRRSSKRRTTGGKRVSSKKRTTSKRRRSSHRRRF